MPSIESKIDVAGEAFARNRDSLLALIARLRALEARTGEASAKMPKPATPRNPNAPASIAQTGTPSRNSTPADILPAALAATVAALMAPAAERDNPSRSTSSVGIRPVSAMYWNV